MSNPNSENKKISLDEDKIQQPSTSGVRLQTFKKRDLTLGTNLLPGKLSKLIDPKNKKVHIPNLNVRRNKTKSEVNIIEKKPKKENVDNKSKFENKHRNRFIQGKGIFGDGIATDKINKPSQISYDRIIGQKVGKIKMEPHSDEIEEGEEYLSQMIDDEVIQDELLDPNDYSYKTLPFLPNLQDKLKNLKIENYSLEEKIKKETNSLGIKIKKEVEDNSYGDNIPMIVKTEPSEETKIKDVLNVKKIFEGKEPFLMQLPEMFHSMGEGHIGDLRIYKSGKVSMKLGDVVVDLEKGHPLRTHMELMNAQLDENNLTGEMISLGQIKDKVIVYHDPSTVFRNK